MPETLDPAETVANSAFTALTTDLDAFVEPSLSGPLYTVPAGSGVLYGTVERLDNEDITTRIIAGTGTFDAMMAGFKAHLEGEYKANRITGADYAKSFVALTEGAMSNAVQFLLGRDQAYFQAIAVQMQARVAEVQLVTARVALETAKMQMAQVARELELQRATYALTKMKLATESVAFDTAGFNLLNMLPVQLELAEEQVLIAKEQLKLVQEQVESQRAQTLDTRIDGTAIVGTLGKQKALITQQITSYQRDAEVKAAKVFADAWMTMKTIDDALEAPANFANASLDAVLSVLKSSNGF